MTGNIHLQPCLGNERVTLLPLQSSHYDALYAVAADPGIWEQHPAKERSTPEGFAVFFREALECGSAFVILDTSCGEVIGTSRFKPSAEWPRAVEIGWTFLARKYWGGLYNRAVKALMIEYAFRYFEVILFYIDRYNFRSRKAVEKIGAQLICNPDGQVLRLRTPDTVIYALHKPGNLQQAGNQ